MAALLAFTAGCPRDEPGPSIGDVTDEPARYYGREVTLAGRVQNVLSDRAFVLESRGFWANDILVLTRTPIRGVERQAPDRGDEIQVMGTVRRFVAAEVERDIGWALEGTVDIAYRDRPVLVARSILFLREEARWHEGGSIVDIDPPAPEQAIAPPPAEHLNLRGDVMVIEAIVTATDPAALEGREVELVGVPVLQRAGARSFWLGESAAQRLFMAVEGDLPQGVRQGVRVDLAGVVRRMPPAREAAERWGVSRRTVQGERIYIEAQRVSLARAPGAEAPGAELDME